jgi:methylthioribose-1-phosphate isomerase
MISKYASFQSRGAPAPAAAAAACWLQDAEQLVAAGANQLEVAQRWEQQTQVRPTALNITVSTAAKSHAFLQPTIAVVLEHSPASS